MAAKHRSMMVLVLGVLAAGCSSGPTILTHNLTGYGQMPPGKTAVLKVTAQPLGKPMSFGAFWGIIETPNAPSALMELLAHVAHEQAGLDVIPPAEVNRKLKAAGITFTLEPDQEQIENSIQTLGLESYLTAHVDEWGSRWLLTSTKAAIRFQLSCYLPGSDGPLWTMTVEDARKGLSDREIAVEALREAFRYLKASPAQAQPAQ